MTIHRAPYKDEAKDRWYADKDPKNEWTYVWDLTNETTLNNTLVVQAGTTATASDDRVTLLAGPTVEAGKYIKAKFSGPFAGSGTYADDANVAIYAKCDNGDGFAKTLWLKPVRD